MRCQHLAQGGLICTDPDRPGAPSVLWCEDRDDCSRTRTVRVQTRMREIAAAARKADLLRCRDAAGAAQAGAGRDKTGFKLPADTRG